MKSPPRRTPGLVLPDVKVHPDNETFTAAAIYDPRFQEPWLLACPLLLSGAALRGLYRDRWPVEQVPLAAKQMLGGARQFVSAPESSQRLAELNLLAGAIITYLAATLPAVPTGFWDRQPKPTPGRLRRLLAETPPAYAGVTLCPNDFGKRSRSSTTCPRASGGIAELNGSSTPGIRRGYRPCRLLFWGPPSTLSVVLDEDQGAFVPIYSVSVTGN